MQFSEELIRKIIEITTEELQGAEAKAGRKAPEGAMAHRQHQQRYHNKVDGAAEAAEGQAGGDLCKAEGIGGCHHKGRFAQDEDTLVFHKRLLSFRSRTEEKSAVDPPRRNVHSSCFLRRHYPDQV